MKRLIVFYSLVVSLVLIDVSEGKKKGLLEAGLLLAGLLPHPMPMPIPVPIPIRIERDHHHKAQHCPAPPPIHIHKSVHYIPIERKVKKPKKSAKDDMGGDEDFRR